MSDELQILISPKIANRLQNALIAAGTVEIGGILMGEHVRPNEFHIVNFTVETGSDSNFFRDVKAANTALDEFFCRTEGQYQRFNYMGEWHSHPSFTLSPSQIDIDTVTELATDELVGANFVVLLIVQLWSGKVQGATTLFLSDGMNYPVKLKIEVES